MWHLRNEGESGMIDLLISTCLKFQIWRWGCKGGSHDIKEIKFRGNRGMTQRLLPSSRRIEQEQWFGVERWKGIEGESQERQQEVEHRSLVSLLHCLTQRLVENRHYLNWSVGGMLKVEVHLPCFPFGCLVGIHWAGCSRPTWSRPSSIKRVEESDQRKVSPP